ncbi:hypothetical protein SAMN02745164_02276 [Marinitoga hydrogenitolerans DSM 16785]|uniref:DUF1232 domain-containing protein n=1 Tax=Marinitoga hydrogenitolerans (strain DSM 16785 / JCM 12826 / AT1271) TaxID=1122195 RepID=A0A1M5AVJ3_MARH1|nr:hypothetical protein [Marinitoga hydrogenitolerans]SHF34278.1 hypothetical protein SAMN02745164_02276 [Marinitoga hydrogenitolerans DSM 16785]
MKKNWEEELKRKIELEKEAYSISEIEKVVNKKYEILEKVESVNYLVKYKNEIDKMFDLLEKYLNGSKNISKDIIKSIGFALYYILETKDHINDETPFIGYYDDQLVLELVIAELRKEKVI